MPKAVKVVVAVPDAPSSIEVKCPLCGSTRTKYTTAGYTRGVKCKECGILIPVKAPAL